MCFVILLLGSKEDKRLDDTVLRIGSTRLKRVYHNDSVTGGNDHFGTLLFDPDGRMVKWGNKTWIYTGSKVEDDWVSNVRGFDPVTLEAGPKSRVLTPVEGENWASIHLAIRVDSELYVVFYSTGKVVRAALGERPEGPFERDAEFELASTEAWEEGALESDGGFVKIGQEDGRLRFWMLYDNLGPGTSGQNGWAEVEVDGRARQVRLVRKHPGNPIGLLLPDRLAARTGGNVSSDVRIDGLYPLFYMSKPARREYRIGVALSDDPLFQTVQVNTEFDTGSLGDEVFSEKYQFYVHDDLLYVIYEMGDKDVNCRTAVRKYAFLEDEAGER